MRSADKFIGLRGSADGLLGLGLMTPPVVHASSGAASTFAFDPSLFAAGTQLAGQTQNGNAITLASGSAAAITVGSGSPVGHFALASGVIRFGSTGAETIKQIWSDSGVMDTEGGYGGWVLNLSANGLGGVYFYGPNSGMAIRLMSEGTFSSTLLNGVVVTGQPKFQFNSANNRFSILNGDGSEAGGIVDTTYTTGGYGMANFNVDQMNGLFGKIFTTGLPA